MRTNERPTASRFAGESLRRALGALTLMILATTTVFGTLAHAQTYPSRPVRIIAVTAGTTGDVLARYVAQRLSDRWGQPVIVENRSGVAIIAAEAASKAAPDGYTLHLGQFASFGTASSLYSKLGYDPVRDFMPVTMIASMPSLVLANLSIPASDLKSFIEYAKARPGALNYGSAGSGTTGHLTFELLNRAAGVKLVHVPYKGSVTAFTAAISGEVHVASAPIVVALPQVKAGKIRGYAVTGRSRSAQAPDIPAVSETLPGFESTTWFGVLVPARTAAGIVRKLNVDTVQIIDAPATRSWLVAQGADPAPGTPEEFGAFIRSEIAKWGKVIREAGITVQ